MNARLLGRAVDVKVGGHLRNNARRLRPITGTDAFELRVHGALSVLQSIVEDLRRVLATARARRSQEAATQHGLREARRLLGPKVRGRDVARERRRVRARDVGVVDLCLSQCKCYYVQRK